MKAVILILAVLISLLLLILMVLPWCAAHLPMEASLIICLVAVYFIIFGLCAPLARQLGIY
jgi:hypothetical protein